MNTQRALDRCSSRIARPFTAVLLLGMLLTLSSCTSWRKQADYKKLNRRVLEDRYMRVIQLENQVDAKTLQSVTPKTSRNSRGRTELSGTPFWTAPQFEWIRSIDTAVMSAGERRRFKLKLIKKYGVGYVVFKPDPADTQFPLVGESDDEGFTMAELHRAFGPKLPPFSSLLQLSLRRN
ncbi:hypothetical protein [Prosthecobacter vanneervenii]|uniref:Lipoprotein n=1 Tax=Prosthecobacter vanneervenii TaxID=48466 RepID=A0A7W7Y940_9BACT|nr:hypothetical protein [Prosthecobacter vanneervenii]MBB5031692.1 hypothetical protein [Prosthecobacter vanneervenii]